MYKLTALFGWLNAIFASLCLLALPFIHYSGTPDKSAVAFILALQLIVSSAMIFASRQRAMGSDIGEKAYPATLAAYVLLLFMAYRWFVN